MQGAAMAMLGLIVALALSLIGFVLQQDWPSVVGGPLPILPAGPSEAGAGEDATLPDFAGANGREVRFEDPRRGGIAGETGDRDGEEPRLSIARQVAPVDLPAPSPPNSQAPSASPAPSPSAPSAEAPVASPAEPAPPAPPAPSPAPAAPSSSGPGKNGKGLAKGHEKSKPKEAAPPPVTPAPVLVEPESSVSPGGGEAVQATDKNPASNGNGHAYGKSK